MECTFCGSRNAKKWAITPISILRGRELGSFTCLSCAAKHGLFCEKHDKLHQGFFDNTHACEICIIDLVREMGPKRSNEILEHICSITNPDEFKSLFSDAELSSMIMGWSPGEAVVCFIASVSFRKGKSPNQIMMEIEHAGAVKDILSLRGMFTIP